MRVVLADDHPVVLAGVKALLAGTLDIEVVGEATSGSVARALMLELMPDIAVIDVSLPDMSGISLTQALLQDRATLAVLILTVHEERAYVRQVLQAGARGYLLKRSAAEDLVRAIRALAQGGVYLDPAITEKAVDAASGSGSAGARDHLSPREDDVLRLMAQGYSNKEIAARICVSVKSVETYKARAVEKLKLRTRAEIVRYGLSRGWLHELAGG